MSDPRMPVRQILGMPLHAVTLAQALDRVDHAVRTRERLLIGVLNAAKLVGMRDNAVLRDDVLGADLLLADGMSLVWAGRLLGRPLPERVAGIDLMMGILQRGGGRRIYCLGATPEVLGATLARIARDFPDVAVVGSHHGYFGEGEEPAVAEAIRTSRADVLFVAMTSPKKERFLARWQPVLGVPVTHGVGGSFDVLAGKVQRAPLGWQRLGLEWLYRLKQEPRRLWKRYLVTNAIFAALVLREMLRNAGSALVRLVTGGRAAGAAGGPGTRG